MKIMRDDVVKIMRDDVADAEEAAE